MPDERLPRRSRLLALLYPFADIEDPQRAAYLASGAGDLLLGVSGIAGSNAVGLRAHRGGRMHTLPRSPPDFWPALAQLVEGRL